MLAHQIEDFMKTYELLYFCHQYHKKLSLEFIKAYCEIKNTDLIFKMARDMNIKLKVKRKPAKLGENSGSKSIMKK